MLDSENAKISPIKEVDYNDPIEQIAHERVRQGVRGYLTQLGITPDIPEYTTIAADIKQWSQSSQNPSTENEVERAVIHCMTNGIETFLNGGIPDNDSRVHQVDTASDADGSVKPRRLTAENLALRDVQVGTRYKVVYLKGGEYHPNTPNDYIEAEEWKIQRIVDGETRTVVFRLGYLTGDGNERRGIIHPDDRAPFQTLIEQRTTLGVGKGKSPIAV